MQPHQGSVPLEEEEGGAGGGTPATLYGTLPVARVAEECDMKEEVMETLLSYLEVVLQP